MTRRSKKMKTEREKKLLLILRNYTKKVYHKCLFNYLNLFTYFIFIEDIQLLESFSFKAIERDFIQIKNEVNWLKKLYEESKYK